MYNHFLQRYYNEHIHLPEAFFEMPVEFMSRLMKAGPQFFANAYNYVEPKAEGHPDVREYAKEQFRLNLSFTEDRICIIVETPTPEGALHCRMIGVSLKTDGTNPIYRTLELAESGDYFLCGWTESHAHLNISEVNHSDSNLIGVMLEELVAA